LIKEHDEVIKKYSE